MNSQTSLFDYAELDLFSILLHITSTRLQFLADHCSGDSQTSDAL